MGFCFLVLKRIINFLLGQRIDRGLFFSAVEFQWDSYVQGFRSNLKAENEMIVIRNNSTFSSSLLQRNNGWMKNIEFCQYNREYICTYVNVWMYTYVCTISHPRTVRVQTIVGSVSRDDEGSVELKMENIRRLAHTEKHKRREQTQNHRESWDCSRLHTSLVHTEEMKLSSGCVADSWPYPLTGVSLTLPLTPVMGWNIKIMSWRGVRSSYGERQIDSMAKRISKIERER